MEFPPDWDCFPLQDFDTAAVRNPLNRGVELLTQARPNGRLLDHNRLVLGGDELIVVKVAFSAFMYGGEVPDWILCYSLWPRAIRIKRNMVSSEWDDVRSLFAANDARVELSNGQAVEQKSVLDYFDGISDKTANSAAFRWAVVVGDDGRMKLGLQSLPAPAASFTSKPVFCG